MKKLVLTILIVSFLTNAVSAQKTEDGIQALYYQRYTQAQSILEKISNTNPKDGKAVYWLGQVYLQNPTIAQKDRIEKAKNLYQSGLSRMFNEPYLLVGMGEIDLWENNNIASAKQKFDQAVLSSKNNPGILNAIGRANAIGESNIGDPAYAVELLKNAQTIDAKNPDINYNLARNYLKIPGSTQAAIEALLEATKQDPHYAKALYELGKIYENQGNTSQSNTAFQKALEADANYVPTYLFTFKNALSNNDYSTAEVQIKKYISLIENDTKGQYYLAYVLLKKGDNTNAQKAISSYLHNTPTSTLISNTYSIAAQAYRRIPDSSKYFYTKAFDTDTSFENRVASADSLTAIYTTEKDSINTYFWTKKKYQVVPNTQQEYKSKTALPQLCAAAVKAIPVFKNRQEYSFIDSAFTIYIGQNPDKEFGYFGLAKIAISVDSSIQKASQPIDNYVAFLEKDKTKNKSKLIHYYDLLGQYYTNAKKDYKQAAKEYQNILTIDPNNARAKDILSQLSKTSSLQ